PALVVGGELPSAVASDAHDGEQLCGCDEELAAIVRVRLGVQLLSKWSIRLPLIRCADGHAAIERQLERAEAKPVVAGAPGVASGLDRMDQFLDWPRCIRPPSHRDT